MDTPIELTSERVRPRLAVQLNVDTLLRSTEAIVACNRSARLEARCRICREVCRIDDDLACRPCMSAQVTFQRRLNIDDGKGDAEYVYHELAHFVTLYRRPPRSRVDIRHMQKRLDAMSVARSQVHELRVIKLQCAAYRQLGWRPSLRAMFVRAWPGIRDADVGPLRCGLVVIWTKTDALARLRTYFPSERLMGAYIRALKEIRLDGCL